MANITKLKSFQGLYFINAYFLEVFYNHACGPSIHLQNQAKLSH